MEDFEDLDDFKNSEEFKCLDLGNGFRLLSDYEVMNDFVPRFVLKSLRDSELEMDILDPDLLIDIFCDNPWEQLEIALYANVVPISRNPYDDFVEEPKQVLLGSLYGYYFDPYILSKVDTTLSEAMDDADQETSDLYENLDSFARLCGFEEDYDSLFYISRLEVEEQFRGHGYGSYLMDNIEDILLCHFRLTPKLIVGYAQPFISTDNDEKIVDDNVETLNKLFTFYEDNGFSRLDNTHYVFKLPFNSEVDE